MTQILMLDGTFSEPPQRSTSSSYSSFQHMSEGNCMEWVYAVVHSLISCESVECEVDIHFWTDNRKEYPYKVPRAAKHLPFVSHYVDEKCFSLNATTKTIHGNRLDDIKSALKNDSRCCSQHRFTTWRQFSNYRNSYPGFSSGRPRGTTLADDRYIVLQARRNRWQTAGEIARHTTQVTGRPISRFTVARRLHGGGLFARRPVRCVPLTPAHRRRRSLWCREQRNWRDNKWGRVLFTDESSISWRNK
ncbi:transposable element Tc3 transposase [Trichonephila clavipes]|nr:transposable element Tc3 transposase [Trichonephila clavipes]